MRRRHTPPALTRTRIPFAARRLGALALAAGALVALLAPAPAAAHDTWFELAAPDAGGGALLLLGTGAQAPRRETAVAPEYLARRGCLAADGAALALQPQALLDDALPLRAAPGAVACHAELPVFELDLPPALVAAYLDEIAAGPALRAAWAARSGAGHGWREGYSKHARIELRPADRAAADAQAAGLALELVPLAAGGDGAARFALLRDGQPLAGLPVQLVGGRLPRGLWLRSDGQGRLALPAGMPGGDYLLRATDLRPDPAEPSRWHSRFVTLAFALAGAPRR